MIIDCHGHFTTIPKSLRDWRAKQADAADDPSKAPLLDGAHVSDDQIREAIENGQLKLQKERGSDLTLFSPIAGLMSHHLGNERTSLEWAAISNDLVHRVTEMYPDNFAPVGMLPQSPHSDWPCRPAAGDRAGQTLPSVNIILDHLARPDVLDGAPYANAQSLWDLADLPNVYFKLTPRIFGDVKKGQASAESFFGKVVETFGADRLAWGSNFPTSPGTLADILATAQAGLASMSEEDREWIFSKTALKLYPTLAGDS
jgi:hypothetical protein